MLADEPYIGTVEAAKRLRVHRRTVLRWVHDGLIPGAVELPSGRFRIPEAAIESLIRPVEKASA